MVCVEISPLRLGSLGAVWSQVGRIMLALREKDRTPKELAAAARIPLSEVEEWTAFLSRLEYVTPEGGRYRSIIPVMTKADTVMVRRLRNIGREVMTFWLAENYPKLRAEMAGLTPMRWSVPYAEGFTMIWHFIFGMANQRLVEAGLFADPYAEDRKYKGFIPAVFAASIE